MRIDADIRHAIGAGEELRDIAHRRHAVRAHIGADVDADVAAYGEDQAVAVEGIFDVAVGLARVRDGAEMLTAVFDPFHRTAEAARGKGNEGILGVEPAAGAETAPPIA